MRNPKIDLNTEIMLSLLSFVLALAIDTLYYKRIVLTAYNFFIVKIN